jgi:hypothetical protein
MRLTAPPRKEQGTSQDELEINITILETAFNFLAHVFY